MAIPWLVKTIEFKQDGIARGNGSDVAMADELIDKAIRAGLTPEELREAGAEAAQKRR